MDQKQQSQDQPVQQENREDRPGAEPQRDGIQGEGNYGASRAFNDAERKFVESGKGPARPEEPKSEQEREELVKAEEAARRRARQ